MYGYIYKTTNLIIRIGRPSIPYYRQKGYNIHIPSDPTF